MSFVVECQMVDSFTAFLQITHSTGECLHRQHKHTAVTPHFDTTIKDNVYFHSTKFHGSLIHSATTCLLLCKTCILVNMKFESDFERQ